MRTQSPSPAEMGALTNSTDDTEQKAELPFKGASVPVPFQRDARVDMQPKSEDVRTGDEKPENEAAQQLEDETKNRSQDLGSFKFRKKLTKAVNLLEEEIEDFVDTQKANYPEKVGRQIHVLRQLGKKIVHGKNEKESGPSDPSSDGDAEWFCEVERLTMDDWQKDWIDDGPSKPVIKAYYRFSTTGVDESSKLMTSNATPQKVAINSTILISELEDILEVKFAQSPVLMAPPFKFLVRYFPQVKERLVQLKSELETMKNTPVDSKSKRTPSNDTVTSDALHSEDSSGPKHEQKRPNDAAKRRKELTARIAHMQLLSDFVEADLAYYLDLQDRVENITLDAIAFEDLWYLFRPGDILLAKEQGHDQLYKIYAVTGGQLRRRNHNQAEIKEISDRFRPPTRYTSKARWDESDDDDEETQLTKNTLVEASGIGTWTPFTIDCYCMGYDGLDVGPLDRCKKIKHYGGKCKIFELPVYPLRFHENQSQLLKSIEDRGRKFIASYGHKSYNGLTFPSTRRGYQESLKGEIFVDFKDYYRRYPRRKPQLGMLRKSSVDKAEVSEVFDANGPNRVFIDHEADDKITESFMASHHAYMDPVNAEFVQHLTEYLQLFPYQVPAYVFRTKVFVLVDIDVLAEIDKTDEARDRGFEDLVIPDTHRNLLVALVQNHETGQAGEFDTVDVAESASSQIEIVRGKGRGLIILLHGPPGSGKTSTAETIAAYTRRPLYSLTCGDLGPLTRDVERALKSHAERAYRWGCILLLDEADVFLTRRDWRDTYRNSLVSVFLRQLEYYSGILFLTTNRVGVLDEAFKSRIHVSLCYPRIRLRETLQIWENTLNRISRDNKTSATQIRFDKQALLTFAEKHYRKHEADGTTWNGRQIRNAFQTAIALGHYDRQKADRDAGLTDAGACDQDNKPSKRHVRLTVGNFRSIAKTARDFEDYITNVRGPDSSIAKENQLRDDEHNYEDVPRRKDYGKAREKKEKTGYLTPSPSRGLPVRTQGESSKAKKAAPDSNDESEDEDIFENLSD